LHDLKRREPALEEPAGCFAIGWKIGGGKRGAADARKITRLRVVVAASSDED